MHRIISSVFIAVFLLLGATVSFAAENAAIVKDSTVFDISAADFIEMMDTNESFNISADENGISLTDNANFGEYISLPMQMPEFSKMSMIYGCKNTTESLQPKVFLSVYRAESEDWSDWIEMPDGENAKRTKSKQSSVLLKYKIELFRDDNSEESMLFYSIFVTAGELFFSSQNTVMVFIMLSALLIYLYRKKKYGAELLRIKPHKK